VQSVTKAHVKTVSEPGLSVQSLQPALSNGGNRVPLPLSAPNTQQSIRKPGSLSVDAQEGLTCILDFIDERNIPEPRIILLL
jgi:hypothetical protein